MIKTLTYTIKCSEETLKHVLYFLREEKRGSFQTELKTVHGEFQITFSFVDEPPTNSIEKYLNHWLGNAAHVLQTRFGPFTAELKPEVVAE